MHCQIWYSMLRPHNALVPHILLCIVLATAALMSLVIGPADLSIMAVIQALAGLGEATHQIIVWEIRLPRTLLALMIGATLAMSGAALQGFVRNPLASPSLLGTSNFAAFGAVVAIYFGTSNLFSLAVPIAAITMSGISVVVLIVIAGRDSRMLTLILAGLALSSLASALTALALNLAPNPFAAVEITYWLLGSLADRSFEHVTLAAPFMIISWALLLYDRRALLALSLGEETAQTLGVALDRVRLRLVLALALGVGAAVAVSGIVGFVGLVVPHLMRPLVGYDPSRLLIPSALAGAALLTVADCLVRLLSTSAELKLGIITALVGVPFFLFLLFKERRGQPAFM